MGPLTGLVVICLSSFAVADAGVPVVQQVAAGVARAVRLERHRVGADPVGPSADGHHRAAAAAGVPDQVLEVEELGLGMVFIYDDDERAM